MDPEATVLDTLLEVRGDRTIERVRTIAGAYLFRGEDVFKCLRELSVGQKCRVALAWMAMQGVNTLILDEPTNHLDIQSQEELQSVLMQFDGTILFVTHDRSLAQALATDVWCVEAGTVQEVQGGWNEYLEWRAERTRRPAAAAAGKSREAYERLDEERQQGHRQREKQQQQNARRILALEAEIPETEARLKALSAEIDQAGANQHLDLLTDLCLSYQRMEAALKLLWDEWERLSSEG
jgi:ATP-binding cassette subfamily F protein 3